MGASSLRRAALADLEFLHAIERLSFPDPWTKASLLEEIDSEEPPVVALLEGQVAGYLCLWSGVDEFHITNLAVHPDHRRRGLGRELLEFAIDLAVRAGCQRLLLEVRPSNTTALRLYAGLGFVELYRRRGYYIKPSEDGLVMMLALNGPHSLATRPEGRKDT